MTERLATEVGPRPRSSLSSTASHARLLQRKCACGGSPGLDGECAECRSKKVTGTPPFSGPPVSATFRSVSHELGAIGAHSVTPGVFAAKVTVGRPGDEYEQEADRVAAEVMRMPERRETSGEAIPGKLEPFRVRQPCSGCKQEIQRQPIEEEEELTLEGKEASGFAPEVTPALHRQLKNMRGGGEPLYGSVRSFFEARFGHDFGNVRVHTDSLAAQSAHCVRAQAYTVGKDIVFAQGRYAPETRSGKWLLAHELTHVLQQDSGRRLMRQEEPGGEEEFFKGPPEQSALIPKWVADQFGPVGGAGAVEEAAVATKATDSGWLESPERQAATETPYQTGMSAEQIAATLDQGRPLEGGLRASLEGRYGQALGHIRIHADGESASLCEQFGARAFAFRNHIAFGRGAYAPRTTEGQRLLRHELAHVLQDRPSRGDVFRACAGTCAPAGALLFTPVSDPSFNCYAYALNSPGSGFLQPGQSAGTPEFTDLSGPDPARRTAAAATYFTPAGMLRNIKADLGSPISTSCTTCCASPKRKIIAVTTDALASVGAGHWDFHWYRKDSDRAWSHKRGSLDAQRDDAAGTSPICNPCTASRSYAGLSYNNVVGSWCV